MANDAVYDWVVPLEFFQGGGVGGVAGFSFAGFLFV